MKKVLLFAAVAGVVSLTSCKKDYECTCTDIPVLGEISYDLGKLKKADAETACSVYDLGGYNCSISAK